MLRSNDFTFPTSCERTTSCIVSRVTLQQQRLKYVRVWLKKIQDCSLWPAATIFYDTAAGSDSANNFGLLLICILDNILWSLVSKTTELCLGVGDSCLLLLWLLYLAKCLHDKLQVGKVNLEYNGFTMLHLRQKVFKSMLKLNHRI